MPLVKAVDRLAAALGSGPAAQLAASALLEADMMGLPQFGIAMLEEWAENAARPGSDKQSEALSWVDCTGSFAPLSVAGATIDLAATARRSGIAAVFLRGVRGFGRLAPFVRYLADQGLIGIAGAEGPPFVAPFGGNRPVIGTNPLAYAMGQGSDRVVIDVASSMATMADIRRARGSGDPLQDGVAMDSHGQPTSVAADVAALLPRGGQIGSLIGLMVELMAGVAGGGRGDKNGRGVFIMAIDPAKSDGVDWQARLTALQADWTEADGHWPRGGGVSPDKVLDDDVMRRLDTYVARMTGNRPQGHSK